jgi:hypothetical protein
MVMHEALPWCNDDDSQLDLVTMSTSSLPGDAIACGECGCVKPMGETDEEAGTNWDRRPVAQRDMHR